MRTESFFCRGSQHFSTTSSASSPLSLPACAGPRTSPSRSLPPLFWHSIGHFFGTKVVLFLSLAPQRRIVQQVSQLGDVHFSGCQRPPSTRAVPTSPPSPTPAVLKVTHDSSPKGGSFSLHTAISIVVKVPPRTVKLHFLRLESLLFISYQMFQATRGHSG